MMRPKIRGEHWAVICVDGLPSQTLHEFRSEIRNKANQKDRVGERTADTYERNVRRFIEYLADYRNKEPLDADTSDLRQFLRRCRRDGDKDNTIKTRRTSVSRFYGELPIMAEDGILPINVDDCPENPEEGYDATWAVGETEQEAQSGEEVQHLPPEDVKKLWENVPAPRVRNRLIIKLAYQTGMRATELCHIRHERDIDRGKREITVPAVTSKSDSRKVAYKDTLDPLLRRWIDGGLRDAVPYAGQSEYLFPTKQSERISRETLRTVVRQAADSAGLNHTVYTDKSGNVRTKVSTHTLRHSMAVNSLKAGVMNVRELQEFLGHSDLETTEKYLKIASDDATDAYRRNGGPPEDG
ncbi:tyrosine-type recombinase/integrase [Halolamina salifodinae]|uniref:Integrase/recombinase XerD n=1 Tax=Halolamina salifodinae TaxID=1202767 RepID=A0A8T4GRT1_9EURY|nr:tyrosine-type recombinase/integrase [Halolamina salifodinae]MBP1985851.1 integrase/recombinase XerD [Halolamina salifodinae]